uniref:Uncharacterized protein n=1 Tax=Sphaerodactylus townsendi TaxID=933632 RepID=A0ACB8ER76_9SAUR
MTSFRVTNPEGQPAPYELHNIMRQRPASCVGEIGCHQHSYSEAPEEASQKATLKSFASYWKQHTETRIRQSLYNSSQHLQVSFITTRNLAEIYRDPEYDHQKGNKIPEAQSGNVFS